MRLVALTGGIGSGKSSVSNRLVALGAQLIDADAIVAELQRPGEPVFLAMVERWGDKILATNGELDRPAVAKIVFGDADELKALNKIVHPAVGVEMKRRMDDAAPSSDVVILDIPLLTEGGGDRRGAGAVIVVDCPVDIAVARLIEHRGFDEADAKARVNAQAKRHERLALANWAVDNSGPLDALDDEIARCWIWLDTLPQTPWPPPGDEPKKEKDQ